jgi:E3 ubiquitin-protein ligase MYCBP2
VEVDEGSEKSVSSEKPNEEVQETQPDNQFLKKRKFKASDSAGLRIRTHPSLQSEQLGTVPLNGMIGFNQEVHNDDGIWVKLDDMTMYAYCESSFMRNTRVEGWCLQYNQHVGKTLLFPVEGPKRLANADHQTKGMVSMRRLNDPSLSNTDNRYTGVKY